MRFSPRPTLRPADKTVVLGACLALTFGVALTPPKRAQAQALSAQSTSAPAAAKPVAAPQAANRRAPSDAKGPIGWEVYRRLDRLPQLTTGVDTRQFSSFDRAGGNDDGFIGTASCLRQTSENRCVIAETEGAGEVESVWFTRDEGDVTRTGTIRIELDGRTVLDAPLQDVVNGKLGAPFVYPLVANADQSSGGVYLKVPMPYRHSMRITTTTNPFFYHVSYRVFDDARGVRTFDPTDRALDVVRLLRASGTADPKPSARNTRSTRRSFRLAPGRAVTLARLSGPGAIDRLRLRIPQLVGAARGTIRDDGRAFGRGGYSQFTVAIDPNNEGVVLTRRLSGQVGHQIADVLVDGIKVAQWQPLPPTTGVRWVDQKVALPASATAGKSKITVRNDYVSSDIDFNEFYYWVDSLVGGQRQRTDTVDVGSDHTASESAHAYQIVNQTWQGIGANTYQPSAAQERRVAPSNDVLRHTRLQISFDGRRTVDAPLGEFFGAGLGEQDVRSLLFAMQTRRNGWYTSWWPMPYAHDAVVRLVNRSDRTIRSSDAAVRFTRDRRSARSLARGDTGYFTALSHRGRTTPNQDWNFADVTGTGKFVGVSQTARGQITGGNTRAYLEGDERVYVDGSRTPQLHGTGTEDFYEAGWYFNRGEFTNPFNGSTGHQITAYGCQYECDSAYRLTVADAVPYHSHLRYGIEHGPVNDAPAVYGSTAFLYTRAKATARTTDRLDVGNARSERRHAYRGDGAAQDLTSTFEGDDDDAQVTDDGRASTSPVSFTLSVDRKNQGVRLRRTSDQRQAGQAAEVFVNGHDLGRWTQPLGNATHRWLDDSFLLPAEVTAGQRRLHVRLVPSGAVPWHAATYQAASFVAPFADHRRPGRVTGLTASAEGNRIRLTWDPATDDVGVTGYDVYGARGGSVRLSRATYLGRTRTTQFLHEGLGLRQRWTYRVVAVDGSGHRGRVSGQATATTGTRLVVEGESLLPPLTSTDPVLSQGTCCGVNWSGGAQAWFQANAAGDSATFRLDVPTTGAYDVSAVLTQAPDYGIVQASIDGKPVGNPFDGYLAGRVATATQSWGRLALDQGRHELRLRITGKNPAATNYFAGLDVVTFALAG